MGNIFISYRRDDSAIAAGRIYDRLEHDYGRGSLFMDIDDIPSGVDIRQFIKTRIINCDILLVIIGDQWLPILREKAEDPNDYVRLEIEEALHQDIPIIPIFSGKKVSSVKTSDLPEKLSRLCAVNGIVVDPERDFSVHMDRLKQEIDLHVAALDRFTGRGASNLDRSVGDLITPNTQATENSHQGRTLEGVSDEAEALRSGIEGAPEEGATPEEGCSDELEPELKLVNGEAPVVWNDAFPDLENEFGKALSEVEELEVRGERSDDIADQIELEFELHDLEEDEQAGPETQGDKQDTLETVGLADIERVPEVGPIDLGSDEVSIDDTIVLKAGELPEEGTIDPADLDRFFQGDAPESAPRYGLSEAIERLSQTSQEGRHASTPPANEALKFPNAQEDKQSPPGKRFLVVVLIMAIVLIVGWWLFTGDA